MPEFSYPTTRTFTGLVQFAIDREGAVNLPDGRQVKRGEVIEVKKEKYARGLVANGNFAHVPYGTPVGQPAEFKQK